MRHSEIGSYQLIWRAQPAGYNFLGGFFCSPCFGYVRLRSKSSGDSLYLAIGADTIEVLPASVTYKLNDDLYHGYGAIRQRELHSFLDLLRNEKPMYMTIYDGAAQANGISTSAEPVGEGTDISP
jgi:hypothetical protein